MSDKHPVHSVINGLLVENVNQFLEALWDEHLRVKVCVRSYLASDPEWLPANAISALILECKRVEELTNE